jgi:DNA repair protein RecO (recombination protein O)
MIEHYTKSLVLHREPKGEVDEVFTLYTRDLGKIHAKAKSIRRITSKLSGHLTLGSLNKIRIIENKGSGFQVIDALSDEFFRHDELHKFLDFLDRMTPEREPDDELWSFVESIINLGDLGGVEYRHLLEIMGFGPKFAKCVNCGRGEIAYFMPSDVIFLCNKSFVDLKINEEEVVKIK